MSTPPMCYEDMLSQNARCRTFIWQCAVKRTICGSKPANVLSEGLATASAKQYSFFVRN